MKYTGYMVSVGKQVKVTSSSACFHRYEIAEQTKVIHKVGVKSAVEMQPFVSNPVPSSVVKESNSLLQS